MKAWMRRRASAGGKARGAKQLDRRSALRLGGKIAAGAAGATIAGGIAAAPSSAAPGGNMVLGAANDAGGTTTSLVSSAAAGTLTLSNTGAGPALSVSGVASFVRSGTVAIFAPAMSAEVAVPGGLSTSSHVLALGQNPPATTSNSFEGGYCKVVSAKPDPTTGKVTIYLNGAPIYAIKVAWFVFG